MTQKLAFKIPAIPAPAIPADVGQVFDAFQPPARTYALKLRDLIWQTACQTPGVGPLTETLKWGEPAYLTNETRSGTTLRLGWTPKAADRVLLLVNCKTSLVESWRRAFEPELQFSGTRAVVLNPHRPMPTDALAQCIAMALTYHHRKTSP